MAHTAPLLLLLLTPISGDDPTADWTQWGGPRGDFHVESGPLVDSWPESGPKVLWEQEIGEGYSAILVRDGRLYTMFRIADDPDQVEIVVSLDAETGDFLWDFAYQAGRYDDMRLGFGEGPNATPLLLGERLFTIGITGKLHCLEATSGDLLWELDLHEKWGRQTRREEYGYSGIPLAYGGKLLVLVGGDQHAVVALNPEDGSVAWGSPARRVSYAPPRIVNIAGVDQYLFFSPNEVIAMDPTSGEFLWEYPVECGSENNLTSVVACPDDHLWVAAQLDGGTRVLKITREDEQWQPEAIWTSRTIKQGHWSSIRLGDVIYGSLGDTAPMLVGAIDWRTGEVLWRERGYRGCQVVYADEKMIFTDESGMLGIARLTPEKLDVLCTYPLLEEIAWTVPTLVGTTLYARDKKRIVAVDLARDSG
jgi:outer membrane protein assembly factor BamB